MKTKTLILLFVLFQISILNAQNSGNYRDSINLIFSELNQTEITTGILLDKASPDIDLSNYAAENDSAASFNSWKFIYQMLAFGAFDEQAFLNYRFIDSINIAYRDSDLIPVFILNYNYNQMKPYAIDSNLITVSGRRIIDVAERNENPYNQLNVFCPRLAPLSIRLM